MTPKTIIEKAIKGGWKETLLLDMGKTALVHRYLKHIEKALLDPKFWEAVGKVEGWLKNHPYNICPNCMKGTYTCNFCSECGSKPIEKENWCPADEVNKRMRQVVDARCIGHSIEDYLKTLTP